jgi:hypothetical protein
MEVGKPYITRLRIARNRHGQLWLTFQGQTGSVEGTNPQIKTVIAVPDSACRLRMPSAKSLSSDRTRPDGNTNLEALEVISLVRWPSAVSRSHQPGVGHFRQSDHCVLVRFHGLRDQTVELCRSGFDSAILASITTTISTFLCTSIPAILYDIASSRRGTGRTRAQISNTVTCYHPSSSDGWRTQIGSQHASQTKLFHGLTSPRVATIFAVHARLIVHATRLNFHVYGWAPGHAKLFPNPIR